jgi:hypothetical protein
MLRTLKFFMYIHHLLSYFFLKLIKMTGRLEKNFIIFKPAVYKKMIKT